MVITSLIRTAKPLWRIIKYGGDRPTLHFNSRSKFNEVWARAELQEQYRYITSYPEGDKSGASVALLGA